jgi:hypothetical protein
MASNNSATKSVASHFIRDDVGEVAHEKRNYHRQTLIRWRSEQPNKGT